MTGDLVIKFQTVSQNSERLATVFGWHRKLLIRLRNRPNYALL